MDDGIAQSPKFMPRQLRDLLEKPVGQLARSLLGLDHIHSDRIESHIIRFQLLSRSNRIGITACAGQMLGETDEIRVIPESLVGMSSLHHTTRTISR